MAGPPSRAESQRTKIVCTLGPSSSEPETVRALIRAGMDVARLNFSHGNHDTHGRAFEFVRRIAREEGRNVAVLMDLQGPKIRTGRLRGGQPVELVPGEEIQIVTGEVEGDSRRVSTTYEHFARDVQPGDRILISDGRIELRVERVEPPLVVCRIVRGGSLAQNQGINLPGVKVRAHSLTPKDVQDLEFGLGLGIDYVALSFVRSAQDVADLKARISGLGKSTPVVAKIERPEAVAAFDEIIAIADAAMVARGDLGVETELEEVPRIQKELIRKCNERGRPVITATQMLESMIGSPRPTRAEVADVANAIYDGADAVMLSGETAAGSFPVEAATYMASIAATTDRDILSRPAPAVCPCPVAAGDIEAFGHAIGEAAYSISTVLDVARIVCFTRTGKTALAIAHFRPKAPITAITLSEEARRRCALVWGVEAVVTTNVATTEDIGRAVDEILVRENLAAEGDTVIITAGMPSAIEGRTNLLKLHRVGEQRRD